MKKLSAILLWFIAGQLTVAACTTFFLNKDGQMVFGRNYDWLTGNGMVCTNHRGLAKISSKTQDGEVITWVSRYGSITFNQYGKEFPTGGMNERGLVVELMWLDGTLYPAPDERPAVGVLQWIQYQLDNCSTVEEVIATDIKLRIAASGTTPLHYLVADAAGNAATIEFLKGKMKVHKGDDLPFPVLTNTAYAESIVQTKQAVKSARSGFSFTDNSVERFAKACSMVKQFQQATTNVPTVDYSFSILDKVAQGSHTKWSIVYDITTMKIHFKSLGYPAVRSVAFAAFDFACTAIPMAWDINQDRSGDVAGLFHPFSLAFNSRIVTRSFEESRPQLNVSAEGIRKAGEYAGSISCPFSLK